MDHYKKGCSYHIYNHAGTVSLKLSIYRRRRTNGKRGHLALRERDNRPLRVMLSAWRELYSVNGCRYQHNYFSQ